MPPLIIVRDQKYRNVRVNSTTTSTRIDKKNQYGYVNYNECDSLVNVVHVTLLTMNLSSLF